jgi:hypothetical protein
MKQIYARPGSLLDESPADAQARYEIECLATDDALYDWAVASSEGRHTLRATAEYIRNHDAIVTYYALMYGCSILEEAGEA